MEIWRDQDLVVGQGKIADTFWSRFVGLQFAPELPEGHGLLIRPCNSVHMFFMRFPLDVVFLTKDGVIERLLPDLRPWHVSPVVLKAHMTLELPAGTIARYGLTVGDRLVLKE